MPIPCRGGLQYGNRYFRCWSAAGHGDLALQEAIAQSCDVFFYQLGLKLGLTSLLEDASDWGFRSRTGIDLPGEIASEFPPGIEYYDRFYGPRRWTAAVTLNLAIGQGENAQTLASMVRFYQMLASDGRVRPPYLVHPGTAPGVNLDLTADQLAGSGAGVHQVGRADPAIARQHLVEAHHARERLSVLALADGEVERDRGGPAARAVEPVVVLDAGRELRRDLARQVDAGPRAEAPVARGVEQRGEAELQAELVKKDVAALGDRLLEGQVAVSRGGPAAKVAVAVLQPAPAGDGHVARSEEHTSELQSRLHLVCR